MTGINVDVYIHKSFDLESLFVYKKGESVDGNPDIVQSESSLQTTTAGKPLSE